MSLNSSALLSYSKTILFRTSENEIISVKFLGGVITLKKIVKNDQISLLRTTISLYYTEGC